MIFEQQIAQSMFNGNSEKTFIDKVLAREDVDRIREIIAKEKLTRSDINQLLYLLSGAESKLLNLSAWDRYVILKFFVWIREFVKTSELLYDYKDDLKLKANICSNCTGYINDKIEGRDKCECDAPEPTYIMSRRAEKMLFNNERLIIHNVKFLIDLYLNIGRTSLSVGATGFLETLKNKFELLYPNQSIPNNQPEKKSFFSRRG